MRPVLKKPLGSLVLYGLLAAAVIISAAVTAALQRTKERSVVVYSASSPDEDEFEEKGKDDSSSKKEKSAKKNSSKAQKTTTAPTKSATEKKTKATTKVTKKTTAAKSATEKTAKETTVIEVDFPLDINLASMEELMAIDGVGESTAADIIAFRESRGVVHNMDELLEISGIGNAKLAKLKQYLYVDAADYEDITTTAKETSTKETTTTTVTTQTETVTTTVPEETETETITTEDVQEITEPEIPERQPVNINSADAETIAECLLLDMETAEKILSVRDELGGEYENYLQLLYVDGISKDLLRELRDYILLE